MSTSEKGLGINFGTAIGRAGWVSSRPPPSGGAAVECGDAIPVVYGDGPGGPVIGSAAVQMLHDVTTRQNVCVRVARDLGNQSLYHIAGRDTSPTQVASLILKDLREHAEQKASGGFDRFTIAYPIWFDAVAESALRDAATQAGLTNVTLITQAQATTIAIQRAGHALGDRVLVIDMGAGSTDLSILTKAPSGTYAVAHAYRSLAVGGDDLDRALYAHVAEVAKRQVGHSVLDPVTIDLGALHACRLAKEVLSHSDGTTVECAVQNGTTSSVRVPLSRADFEGLARPKLDEVFRAAAEMLSEANNRSRPVGTIILTGGGSLMPLARRLANTIFSGHSVVIDLNGNAATVGAAWTAASSLSPPSPRGSSMNASTQPKKSTVAPDELESMLNSPEFASIANEARKLQLSFLITGRTGVGKSSTVNSLLGRQVAPVGAYEPTTFEVQQYAVELEGVPFNVVDTPGLCDDLEERGNDDEYIAKMQRAVKGFHSLWFVTRLDDNRVTSDEKRAIKLLSQAFQDKGKVWQSAVIVFTFAGSVTPEEYSARLAKRTELIRREIALYAGPGVAANVPSVAVDNTSDTTPDGNPWRGELYVRVLTSMKREGIITYFMGVPVDPKPRQQQIVGGGRHANDRPDEYETRSRRRRADDDSGREAPVRTVRSSDFTEPQKQAVRETVRTEIVRRYEGRGREIGNSVGLGNAGAWVGRQVGRAVAWLFG